MSTDDRPISYAPTDGLSYDPSDPAYWEPALLDKELERAFEVCHGCRMCFKYCDSFPRLFALLDDRYDGNVRRLTDKDVESVVDDCFQCKLCEVQCPYTPRDNHPFQLDFPKLMHRYRAIQARDRRPTLRDEVLADPDGSAKLARASLGLANTMSRVKVHRLFMEKLLGIHRDKTLPDFAAQTFEQRAEKNGRIRESPQAETVLFQTCYVQNNEPQVGRDTLDVMDRNGIDCGCVRGLVCCGMPAWEQGDLDRLQTQAATNLDALSRYVDAGAKVLVINPTCAMMLRREYPELVADKDRARARKLADAVRDPSEYLWSIRKEPRFNTDFRSTPKSVAYHAPCHLRAQAIGFKGRDLMKKIPGVKPKTIMDCCGHDGTYAMKVESFEASGRVGQRAFTGMRGADSAVWATDCPLAAIQFEQHAGRRAMHPMSVLARAYRDDGFPERIKSPQGED